MSANSLLDEAGPLVAAKEFGRVFGLVTRALAMEPLNGRANRAVGNAYRYGWGCPIDHHKANTHIMKAATLGHIDAQIEWANVVQAGLYGIPRDDHKAAEWWIKVVGVQPGNANANASLGLYFAQTKPPDHVRAFKYHLAAAEAGNAAAIRAVMTAYKDGQGTPKNATKAKEWALKMPESDWRQMVLQGLERILAVAAAEAAPTSAAALIRCGDLYTEYPLKDDSEARKWYTKATIAEPRNSLAWWKLGKVMRFNSGEEKFAAEVHHKAAQLGSVDAMLELGSQYTSKYTVHPLVSVNKGSGFGWYKRAVQTNPKCLEAQLQLGHCYREGIGTAADSTQAYVCYTAAGELGDKGALYRSAHHLEKGDGVTKDINAALAKYRRVLAIDPKYSVATDGILRIEKILASTTPPTPTAASTATPAVAAVGAPATSGASSVRVLSSDQKELRALFTAAGVDVKWCEAFDAEEITVAALRTLDDATLKELITKIGPRQLLTAYLRKGATVTATESKAEAAAVVSTTSVPGPAAATTATPSSLSLSSSSMSLSLEWTPAADSKAAVALEDATFTTKPVDMTSGEFARLSTDWHAALNKSIDDYNSLRVLAKLPLITFDLIGVERVVNETLQQRFITKALAMVAEHKSAGNPTEWMVRESWGFHGTRPENIANICRTGLLRVGHKLNPSKRVDEGFFGMPEFGVYLSRYCDYTLKYSNGLSPLEIGQTAKVIMFRVVAGRSRHIPTRSPGLSPSDAASAGHHSHSSSNHQEWYLFDETQCCPAYVLNIRAIKNLRTTSDDA